jgi:hypothetical protein
MPFFFFVLIWLLCLGAGVILLYIRSLRRLGFFVIAVPTGAMLASFLLSTSVLFADPRFSFPSHPQWSGIALLSSYLAAVVLGAVLGAAGAFWFTARLLDRKA